MYQSRISVLIFQMTLLFCYLVLVSCNSNSKSLAGTKWMIIGVALDSGNTYDDEDRLLLKEFEPSQGLFSEYRNSILINYLNNSVDTVPYRQKGNLVLFYDNQDERKATKILKHTKDSLLILTADGAYYKLVRVDKIPK